MQVSNFSPYYRIYMLPAIPVFRGGIVGGTIPQAQVKERNIQLQPDTVEFSAVNNIKKEKGLSTTAKAVLAILGTVGTIYGCIVGRRILNKPSFEVVQKNLSEILGRDIGVEETRKLLNNYKNIIKNNKTDEYHNQLFQQVKKDMGYENLDIKLIIKKLKDGSFKSFKEHCNNGSAGAANHEITICPKTAQNNLNSSIQRTTFGTMFHEWKHIKQAEIAYRTSPDKLVEAYIEQLKTQNPDYIEQLIKENKYSRTQALKDLRSELHKDLDTLFGKYPKFKAGSDEYKKGLKYIECARNYTTDGKEYFEQLSEKEAFEIGDKARKIYDYISNPWRIF